MSHRVDVDARGRGEIDRSRRRPGPEETPDAIAAALAHPYRSIEGIGGDVERLADAGQLERRGGRSIVLKMAEGVELRVADPAAPVDGIERDRAGIADRADRHALSRGRRD